MPDSQPPLVILDRDGVINRDSKDFIKTPDEFVPLPGSIQAIAELCRAGYRVVVASNQSGVGRGVLSAATLEQIHAKLRDAVQRAGGSISGFFVCPHRPDEGCDCRKPKPGLLQQVAMHFGQDLHNVPVIGDSRRDLDAAEAVGAIPVLVRTGNGAATERQLPPGARVAVYDDLRAAAAAVVAGRIGGVR